tara:strand:- start:106 stop:318 length:213 start_codon:yes stop_codon:yes gene_type:complete
MKIPRKVNKIPKEVRSEGAFAEIEEKKLFLLFKPIIAITKTSEIRLMAIVCRRENSKKFIYSFFNNLRPF